MILWLALKNNNFLTSIVYFGNSGTPLLREQRIFCVLPCVRKTPEDIVRVVKAWFLYWPFWIFNFSVYFLILKLPEKNNKRFPLISWDHSFRRSLMKQDLVAHSHQFYWTPFLWIHNSPSQKNHYISLEPPTWDTLQNFNQCFLNQTFITY